MGVEAYDWIAHGYLVLALVARFGFELRIFPEKAGEVVNYGDREQIN